MTYTITQRDALRQAIASGVLRLTYDGKTIEYRSMEELRTALREYHHINKHLPWRIISLGLLFFELFNCWRKREC